MQGKGKIMGLVLAGLAAAAIAIGFWSGWSLLGFMNRLDSVLASGGSRLMVRGEAYGSGTRQKLNIWSPKDDAAAPRDVIIFFYGGSWRMGARDQYDFVGRALAEKDYLVVIPDYRLVPEVRFPGFVEDGAAAVAWVRANIGRFGGNPDRIFVSGHSAGAHIGAMVTLDRQWLAKAGAPGDSIKGFVGLAGPYDFYPFTSESSRNAFGHLADPKISQPINFARGDAPPIMLLTGNADTTVKPRNSLVMAPKISQLGGKAEMRTYAGVDHSEIVMGFANPFRYKAPVITHIDGFIRSVTPPAKAE